MRSDWVTRSLTEKVANGPSKFVLLIVWHGVDLGEAALVHDDGRPFRPRR
jgi:hypothetical protein